jgi:hypothetical protein
VVFTEKVIPLYIESARSYAQLAVGALVLTIAFRDKVLAQKGRMRAGVLLVASWASLLVTIGASAWYQYVAIKLVELIGRDPVKWSAMDVEPEFPLSVGVLWPGYAYSAMVVSFFLGSLLLVMASIGQLVRKDSAQFPNTSPQPTSDAKEAKQSA